MKATVIVGLTLMSVSCLVFAFADTIGVLDAARFLQGVGGACSWAGGMSWIAAEAPRERRGALLGSAMGVAIFGVQLGPVVGAVARGVGQEVAFSSVVVFGVALGVFAWTQPVRIAAGESIATPAEALRNRAMLAGMWLTALPAARSGSSTSSRRCASTRSAPPRSRSASRSSPRPGSRRSSPRWSGATPTAAGHARSSAAASSRRSPALVVLQLPATAAGLAIVVIAVSGLLGVLWVPAMGLLAGGAERIGLDTGFAFAYFNLAWAAGFSLGAFVGGSVAEVTTGRGRVRRRRRPLRDLGAVRAARRARRRPHRGERRARPWLNGTAPRRPERPLRCRA